MEIMMKKGVILLLALGIGVLPLAVYAEAADGAQTKPEKVSQVAVDSDRKEPSAGEKDGEKKKKEGPELGCINNNP